VIENLVLSHLIKDEEYTRKVIPFLKESYFSTEAGKEVFKEIDKFITTYKTSPTFDAIRLGIEQQSITQAKLDEINTLLDELVKIDRTDASRKDWLIKETEKFCQQKALYLAISESITLIDKDFKSASSVPMLLKDALSVSFDRHIGHDYFEDTSQRFDLLHQQHNRIPFDIDMLNKITKGGLIPKTLAIIIGGVNIGKSLFLCHVAASSIAQGKNVLYITMEMAEELIAQRIDANLLDVSMNDLEVMPKPLYENAFKNLTKTKTFGKLVIKEYPTSGAHAGHFRALIDELKLKKNFVPDLLIVDYINICSSVRFKAGNKGGSYEYVKSIAEELRGLAVEINAPCLTATQFNREGYDSSDPSLTNTSESFGTPATADLQLALISTEQLADQGLLLIKQLKNRYSDVSHNRRFTITVDKTKMRLGNDPNQQFLSSITPQTPNVKSVSPTPNFNNTKNSKFDPNDDSIIF